MEEVVTKIEFSGMDNACRGTVSDFVFIEMKKAYGTSRLSKKQFESLLELGLREKVHNLVKEYYDFLGDVEVSIDEDELFAYCVTG